MTDGVKGVKGFVSVPAVDRLLAKIEKTEDGCWLWTGANYLNGYGQFWNEGKRRRAHRVSYELFVGRIPKGLVIDHLCRKTLCVNPDHLQAVTQRENTLRGDGGRRWGIKTHCTHGHALTPDNVYLVRKCRTCQLTAKQSARAKQEA